MIGESCEGDTMRRFHGTRLFGLAGASALLVADLPFAVVFLGVILVIVQTDKNYLGEEEGSLPIVPGMQATVDIHTGKKSVMDYLIRPILKLRHEAFRER